MLIVNINFSIKPTQGEDMKEIDETVITEEVMNQYEIIRSMGPCNMFDYYCVTNTANDLEMFELGSLEKNEYLYILKNFSALMEKYGIEQK